MKSESPHTSRIFTPLQSIGRCGKSTLMQLVIDYLSQSKINHRAIDLDEEHATLQGWYPELSLLPFHSEGDLTPILNHLGKSPVELIDFPAQATDMILGAFQRFQMEQILAEKKMKLTVPLFASNERAAMVSAALIVNELREYADFLVIRNPAKFESDIFDDSKLGRELSNSPEINLLSLTAATLGELDNASLKKKKALTFRESLKELPIASRMEVEHFLNSAARQIGQCHEFLVPPGAGERMKVTEKKASVITKVNPYEV